MPAPLPPRPSPAARLAAAIDFTSRQSHLAAFTARQTTPNAANARQTTPSVAPAQNEPTSADYRTPNVSECPEMSHPAQSHGARHLRPTRAKPHQTAPTRPTATASAK